MRETPTTTRVRAMMVIITDSSVRASKARCIHSMVATPTNPAGMLPRPRKMAISAFTERCR
jgi:hypothetical protein